MKTKILRKAFVSIFVFVGLAMLLAAGTHDGRGFVGVGNALPATVLVVTNTNDSGPGSLRNALAVANDGDTIDATGVSGTILLTSGELQITHNVTINGPGAENLAVDGNAQSRVFHINQGETVTIDGVTVENGDSGGGIFNDNAALTVSNCTVSSNNGAGIFNNATGLPGYANASLKYAPNGSLGTLTMSNCTISGNRRGGVSNNSANSFAGLVVTNCTINGNSADYGGGISNTTGGTNGGCTATVSNTTLSDNSAAIAGGGIYNRSGGQTHVAASLSLMNCTLSGNSATGNGGGISNEGETGPAWLNVSNSTVNGNSATGNGGGMYNDGEIAELELDGTILNADSPGENIFNNAGTVTSLGYNVSSDNGGGFLTGPGDQINTNPKLGPLQDNGGPTFTHALLPGSPAIDTGNPRFTPPPFFDQRGPGFDRVVNGRIDIGSFEVQGPVPTPTPTTTPTPRPSPTPRARPTPPPRS